MPLPQKNTQGESNAAPAKCQPSLLQRRLAAFDRDELEAAKWQNRLKHFAYPVVIGTVGASLFLLAIAFRWLYPRDIEGLGILLGVSVVLAAFFLASYHAQEWVESHIEQYWFWRTSSVLLFITIAGGMLYSMFITANFWLPHFR